MTASQTPSNLSLRELGKGIHRLYKDREHADWTLKTGPSTIERAHSFVLWARSTYFTAACNGKFKEATIRESDMTEYGPFMVHRMLQYCYLLSYDDNPLSIHGVNETYTSKLCTNVHMYNMGDYYDLQGMKLEALNKLKECLKVSEAELAEQDVASLLEVLPWIYSSTLDSDHGLRTVAASFGYRHWGTLVARPDFEEVAAENLKWVIDIISQKRGQESKIGQSSEYQDPGPRPRHYTPTPPLPPLPPVPPGFMYPQPNLGFGFH